MNGEKVEGKKFDLEGRLIDFAVVIGEFTGNPGNESLRESTTEIRYFTSP